MKKKKECRCKRRGNNNRMYRRKAIHKDTNREHGREKMLSEERKEERTT